MRNLYLLVCVCVCAYCVLYHSQFNNERTREGGGRERKRVTISCFMPSAFFCYQFQIRLAHRLHTFWNKTTEMNAPRPRYCLLESFFIKVPFIGAQHSFVLMMKRGVRMAGSRLNRARSIRHEQTSEEWIGFWLFTWNRSSSSSSSSEVLLKRALLFDELNTWKWCLKYNLASVDVFVD